MCRDAYGSPSGHLRGTVVAPGNWHAIRTVVAPGNWHAIRTVVAPGNWHAIRTVVAPGNWHAIRTVVAPGNWHAIRTVVAPGNWHAIRTAAGTSGLQWHNRREWIRKKCKLRRGFVKARMLAGVGTRHVLALVTDERAGGPPVRLLDPRHRGGRGTGQGLGPRGMRRAVGRRRKRRRRWRRRRRMKRKRRPRRSRPRPAAAGAGGKAHERESEASVSAAVAATAAEAGRVICADAAYTSCRNVAPCKELGIVSFINMSKTATAADKGGSGGRCGAVRGGAGRCGAVRGGAGREQLGFGMGYVLDLIAAEKVASVEACKATSRYGRRWTIKTIFSALKCMFGSSARPEVEEHNPGGQPQSGSPQQAGRHGLEEDRMGGLGGGGRSPGVV